MFETAGFDNIERYGIQAFLKGGLSFSLGDIRIPDQNHKLMPEHKLRVFL
jgi:hypothetical protein